MTQEQKDLLLKDLCARLPYEVMLSITYNKYTDETFNARISTIDYCGEIKVRHGFEEYEQVFSLEQVKPYLFPLSSMTEEQKQELISLLPVGVSLRINSNNFNYFEIDTDLVCCFHIEFFDKFFDWLNKNHFDYRGLIEKGLANDATGKNIY